MIIAAAGMVSIKFFEIFECERLSERTRLIETFQLESRRGDRPILSRGSGIRFPESAIRALCVNDDRRSLSSPYRPCDRQIDRVDAVPDGFWQPHQYCILGTAACWAPWLGESHIRDSGVLLWRIFVPLVALRGDFRCTWSPNSGIVSSRHPQSAPNRPAIPTAVIRAPPHIHRRRL